MSIKENQINLKKEIQITSEQISNEEIIKKEEIIKEIQFEEPLENKIQKEKENEKISKNENKNVEVNNNNGNYYEEIYIVENKNKKFHNKRKQQPIYNKLRTESSRNPKINISNYIYKSGKIFPGNKNVTSNLNNYVMNAEKYSIKNPIKEKSKNKLKRNKINETDINNNYNINTNENSNLDDYGNNNINNTNYIYRRDNEIDNIYDNENENDEINVIIAKPKSTKNNKLDLQKQPKKKEIISFDSFNKLQDKKFKYVPNTTKAEGRITYICDYSQENNKDSYYIESPNKYDRHISIYPVQPKLKKRKIKDKKYNKGDKLKKEIEDSKKKFEKIREIEREIKNYFNLNGLDILNRELYDQSATMIQATFRAYLLRIKLYEKLNLYIDIKNATDILKNIFVPRKIIYWENFVNSILEYISSLNTNININLNNNIENEDENEVNLNSEKYQYLNDEFNEVDNSKIRYVKKIPTSFKQKPKNKLINNNCLIEQSCISFYFNNINNKDAFLKQIMKENEELKKQNEELRNNNIIKDTQESMELKLNEELKEISNNNQDIKIIKFNYVLKLLDLKYKELLYKYFYKLENNAILSKYASNLNSNKEQEKNKIIKRLILHKDKNLRNIKDKIFHALYFRGIINKFNEKKNDDTNNIQTNEKETEKEKVEENNKLEEKINEIKKIEQK